MTGKPSYEELLRNVKELEALLRLSEERFCAVVEHLPLYIGVVDASGKIMVWNEHSEKMLGYTREEALGKLSVSDIHESPDEARAIQELAARFGLFEGEVDLVKKDGTRFPVYLVVRAAKGEAGETSRFYGVALDIHERRRAEGALRESEERFRALFEGSLEAIFLADPESGTILDANPRASELLGRPYDEIVGLHQYQIHPQRMEQEARNLFDRFVRDEDMELPIELPVVGPEGEEVPTDVLAQIIQINGRPVVFCIYRDVSERKGMEEELLKVQKLESLGILAGGIAHDYNNLLTGILTNVSIAKVYGGTPEEMEAILDDIERAGLRARNLNQQLLTFAKGGEPARKTQSIAKMVEETALFALRGSNVKCEMSVQEGLWLVHVDQGQISQVINNIIINAYHAMPQGGVLKVALENLCLGVQKRVPLPKGDYVRITIADQGIGIPDTHLAKIFDPFFTTKQKGSGLGLSTAFSVIKKHDGHIEVDSIPGKGTVVHIYLPGMAVTMEGPGSVGLGRLRGEGRVLIMDDEEIVRNVTGRALRKIGYQVRFARDGEEAIAAYQEGMVSGVPFDAVIMDLTIPGSMGGKECVQEILKLDPRARVVVSSGYSNDPVISNFREYGFCDFLLKPYTIEELSETLTDVLGNGY